MKKSFLFMIILLAVANIYSQKKTVLDHDVYNFWNRPIQDAISDDGQWLLSVVKPDNGDGKIQFINLEEDKKFVVLRGDSGRFAKNAAFAAFLIRAKIDSVKKAKKEKKKGKDSPQDSLAFINLSSGKVTIKDVVRSFKMPEKNGRWLAWVTKLQKDSTDSTESSKDSGTNENKSKNEEKKKKAEGTKLVLLDFENQIEQVFENIVEYTFSKEASYLAFSSANKDSTADGISIIDLHSNEVQSLKSGKGVYKNLAWDEQGKQLTFIANTDSFLTERQSFALYYWDADQKKVKKIVDENNKGLAKDWWISEHAILKFSDNGKRIVFGSAPKSEPEHEDDSFDEMPGLDIWHWKDPYLQTMQLKKLKEEQKRYYPAVFHISENRVIQLGRLEIPDIEICKKGDGNFALGLSHLAYRQQVSWDYPEYYDVYIINVKNGDAKKVLTKVQYKVKISPGGRYLFWWDRNILTWNTLNIDTFEKNNLGINLKVPLYNEQHDWPYKADPNGFAGWTKNDRSFLFYDTYDVWAVNPERPEKPINITKEYGRKNKLRFRYKKLDPEEEFLANNILLSAFQTDTKWAGYYSQNITENSEPVKEIYMPKRFGHLRKAKDTEKICFTIEDFQEFPDFWVSDLSFTNPKKITDLNPQQKDYLWGTAEQVKWNSLDGVHLEGILYKPANFDSSLKYPMVVYFYERNSDNLFKHWMPEPHRSIINFTFYASRGYAVFLPDIPYKEGYPGESAYNAVLPGINHLIEKGFIDQQNIAVQGHSWGGYQIAYLVTRTNIFKAAEAGAPVSNMTSAYGGIRWETGKSRMFQYEKTQSRIGGTLWEYPMRYIENSPLFRVDQVETPLLIMHNDQDGHVPWYQGIELFVALRRLGKPSWMITYNNEPHWPTKFVNKKDWAIRLQQYFDYFLKGAMAPVWIKQGVPAIQKGKTTGTELSIE